MFLGEIGRGIRSMLGTGRDLNPTSLDARVILESYGCDSGSLRLAAKKYDFSGKWIKLCFEDGQEMACLYKEPTVGLRHLSGGLADEASASIRFVATDINRDILLHRASLCQTATSAPSAG